MVRVIIIDDESHAREDLKSNIQDSFNGEIEIVGEAESVAHGLSLIQRLEPDLIYLDIHLKDGTGFDLLAQCKMINFEIIFITGYEKHAIKAIKVGALDYIVKPIDPDEFILGTQRAIENKKNRAGHELGELIEVASEYFNGTNDKRIILKTMDSIYGIYERDILYCQAENNYTHVYYKNGAKGIKPLMVSKLIKEVEKLLSENIFVRCHQTYVVNKNYVLKFNKEKCRLILNENSEVPVAYRRKDDTLKKIFGKDY